MLEMAARRARKDGGEDMAKYIFVTGGVVSGLGKGITAAALGRLLKARGLTVAAQKLDPYINVDPGTMSPYQHGEVFVTEDGAETDLDLGHYERFIDEDLNQFSNLTTGKVYWNVLQKERAGRYLGETVQVIPHITGEIQAYIAAVADKTAADVVITEIGGTTGDIESQPFLEAIRQFARARHGECVFIHVTLVPYLASSGEHKSKPTQHSVRELQSFGISPDIIVARCDEPLEDAIRQKIALFCNVEADCVIENETLPVLYEVPMMLEKRRLAEIVCQKLGLSPGPCDLRGWEAMLERIRTAKKPVEIALVGKYVKLHDAYLSVAEALRHGGYENGAEVNIRWIDSERVEEAGAPALLDGCAGVIVPGGFGGRGVGGMIAAARYAREKKVPYLGICLGMQISVIEFARHVAGISDANSGEFAPGAACVIDLMPDQRGKLPKGGTMRLGACPCAIRPGTRLAAVYGQEEVHERHRHRYEFNNAYREALTGAGLVLSGTSPDGRLVEAVELPDHPFYVGVQYHPEFKSRPNRAHPLFRELIAAAVRRQEEST